MSKRVLIIDADNLLVRCIMASALDDLRADTAQGVQFTGGIYASLHSLALIGRMNYPDQTIAFFDNGVPKERMRLLPDYKSKRKERQESDKTLSNEQRDQAFAQVPQSFDIWPTLGITCLSYKDREADDGVAAAAQIVVARGDLPIVVSGDKDLWQCVNYGAHVWDHRLANDADRPEPWLTPESFEDDAGVHQSLYILYRALVGDSSDSIIGAPGVGPKRARAILNGAALQDLEPPEQLRALVRQLKKKPIKRAFEQSVIDSYDHLCRVIPAIDLRRSFGGAKSLRAKLKPVGKVDETAFARHCVRLKFKSILGDVDSITGPFKPRRRPTRSC